jgi:hypothetical protein
MPVKIEARDTVRSTLGGPSRRRRRWLLAIGLAVLLLLGTGFTFLRVAFEGPRLADKVASLLNKRMRGRIEIGSIEWKSADLQKVITGGWVDVTVHDVRVWDDCVLGTDDPEKIRLGDPNFDCTPDDKPDPTPGSKRKPRKLLLWTPELTAQIDIHAAMLGNHDLVFRHVTLHGGEALIEQTREPYPLHAYNRTIVSIVTAFYPRMKAGFRAGIYADTPPPIFDVRDVHVLGMNLTVHVAPDLNKDGTVEYGMAARLEGVDVAPSPEDTSAYLYMDARDPLVQKFYVRLGVKAQRGHVRILDTGPREAFRIARPGETDFQWHQSRDDWYDLEVTDIDLSRLAQLPTDWAHNDYVANTLEVAGTMHTIPCGPGARPEDGATVHVTGGLLDYWDRPYDGQWSFEVNADNLGPTVRTCIKKTVGGEHLGGKIRMSGPFVAKPRVALDLHDMDVDIPLSSKEEPVRLTLAKVQGWIDLVNEQGAIDQTKAVVQGKEPGEALVSATFGLKPLNAQAELDILKPIDVGRFLPTKVATSVGSQLTGKLNVRGDIIAGFQVYNFEVGLGSRGARMATLTGGTVFAKDDFDYIQLNRIHFRGGQTNASINGTLVWDGKLGEYVSNLVIEGTAPDLDVWLRRFNLPAFAKSADGGGGKIVIHGPITKPTISVNVNLTGVPCLGNLKVVDATVNNGIVDFSITSSGLGGSLDGKGVLDTNGALTMIDKLHIAGTHLDASKLCGLGGMVSGTLDKVEADVHGTISPTRSPIDWAALAKVYATAQKVSVFGDSYSDLALCLNRGQADDDKLCRRSSVPDLARTQCEDAKKGGSCIVATAHRDDGGSFDATIANIPPVKRVGGGLGGVIKLEDVPLAVLDPLVGPNTVGGLLSATLALQGKLAPELAPQASGAIQLLRGWVGSAFTGDAQLVVDAVRIGNLPGIAIRGQAMSGRVQIYAQLGTQAPYPVDVQITGYRVELDQFLDLSKKLPFGEPVQAWASGTVSVHTELAPAGGKKPEPEAWIEITELEGILDHQSRDGRRVPLRFSLVTGAPGQYAMSLRVTPKTIELACRNPSAPGGRVPCPAKLDTPAGIVAIEGGAAQAQMNLVANGELNLAKLAPLLENQLDSIDGILTLHGDVKGTVDAPQYAVELTVKDTVTVRPAGGDSDLEVLGPHKEADPDDPKQQVDVPGGQVMLANGSLGFNGFTVRVKDERKGEEGELHVKGVIGLADLRPAKWGLLIDGKISGKMLLALAPTSISQASGLAHIDGDLWLMGTGPLPLVRGTIAFDPTPDSPSPLALVPRGLRREIELVRGSIGIDTQDEAGHRTYRLQIGEDDPVTATIDGEGKLEHVRGSLALRDGAPAEAQVYLDADNVPFHVAGTFDLTLAARDIDLRLHAGAWRARGEVAIVGGKYQRNFELTDQIKPAPPTVAPAKPFWDEYPAIGNADLDLLLDVRRFAVENNIAKIDLQGHGIAITGSPRDPRLSGQIRVAGRGEFQIPLTRARFTSTTGSIDFSTNERASNPRLDFTSDAPDFHDLSGQQHVITMLITGTLEQPLWDLHTNTGLDKSQTLNLLFLGRSPESLRRSLGDQSIGTDPTRVDPTTNPSTGFADQLVKDIAGDWISSLLGTSALSRYLPIDVLRFELSFGTVGVHAEIKATENLRVIGDAEQTIRGQTLDARAELRTPVHLSRFLNDRISLQTKLLTKTYSDPADQAQNIQDAQAGVVYRMFIP